MRFCTLVLLCLVLVDCKKSPESTLPRIPDSNLEAGGGVQETAESTVFHRIYRYAGHADQALGFYAAEMEKRGARRSGDAYIDDNMVSSGGFGRDAAVTPKDPRRPGVYMAVVETPDATHIDVWENVPTSR
ncbi:MAG TPA: hypothetical protein VG496_09555 [Myxococcales bacterium]|nr:hypothetical protein [Myxococcales bacterium]